MRYTGAMPTGRTENAMPPQPVSFLIRHYPNRYVIFQRNSVGHRDEVRNSLLTRFNYIGRAKYTPGGTLGRPMLLA